MAKRMKKMGKKKSSKKSGQSHSMPMPNHGKMGKKMGGSKKTGRG